jgi:ubiquinone/menaquinone biosynthesis C-methylase UbiE
MNSIQTILEIIASHAQKGDLRSVENILLAEWKNSTQSIEIMSHLGYFYFQTGRYARMLEVFQERNRFIQPDETVCRLMAEAYAKLGDLPKSLQWYSQAATLLPSNTEIQQKIHSHHRTLQIKAGLGKLVQCIQSLGIARVYSRLLFRLSWLCIALLALHQSRPAFSLPAFLRFLLRYDTNAVNNGYAYHKTREAILASTFLPVQESSKIIMDVGTGKNTLPLYWSLSGTPVLMLDGSLYGFPVLTQCRQRLPRTTTSGNAHFICGDGCRLPLRDDSVDGISVLCVLEHVPGDMDMHCMDELYRVLKPGGRMVISVETSQTASEEWMHVAYEIGYQLHGAEKEVAYHEVFLRNYSPDSMLQRLANPQHWHTVDYGFYDDFGLPFRRYLDAARHPVLSALFRPVQPLLSLAFYRKKSGHSLTPSSIGYLVLEKPAVKSC